jgi:hypothetical protein
LFRRNASAAAKARSALVSQRVDHKDIFGDSDKDEVIAMENAGFQARQFPATEEF